MSDHLLLEKRVPTLVRESADGRRREGCINPAIAEAAANREPVFFIHRDKRKPRPPTCNGSCSSYRAPKKSFGFRSVDRWVTRSSGGGHSKALQSVVELEQDDRGRAKTIVEKAAGCPYYVPNVDPSSRGRVVQIGGGRPAGRRRFY